MHRQHTAWLLCFFLQLYIVVVLNPGNEPAYPMSSNRWRTSSAFRHASVLVALIHRASVGADQFSLGTTRPPSDSMAASIATRSCGNLSFQSGACPALDTPLLLAVLLLSRRSRRSASTPLELWVLPVRTPPRAAFRGPLGLGCRAGPPGAPAGSSSQSSRRYSPSRTSPASMRSRAGTCVPCGDRREACPHRQNAQRTHREDPYRCL